MANDVEADKLIIKLKSNKTLRKECEITTNVTHSISVQTKQ